MLRRGTSFPAYDDDFLSRDFDYVSPAVAGASIVHSPTSGRDGRGGLTFAVGGAGTFAYDMHAKFIYDPVATIIAGLYVDQTSAQGSLGGRLLTFTDEAEDVFGITTQLGLNIMSDNKLKAFRANAQGSGIVLRGIDQGGDSQVTLLGTSSSAIPSSCFIEVRVIHGSSGSLLVLVNNNTFWLLEGINTAISGQSRSSAYYIGGYASVDTGFTARHHEDLAAIISDVHLVDTVVNAADPNDPTGLIGDHKWLASGASADGALTSWTPNPVQDHVLNINEDPPNLDTVNTTETIDAKDDFATEDVSGQSSTAVLVAYRALLETDSPAQCSESGEPANFEAFVYTEQEAPGVVVTGPSSGGPCFLSDRTTYRAQTVCTISEEGDKVSFKPNADNTGRYFAFLTPVDAAPRLQSAVGPGYFGTAMFFLSPFPSQQFMTREAGGTRYILPFYQPWGGIALTSNIPMATVNDYFQFKLLNPGIGLDVGVLPSGASLDPFNPYATPLGAFHFREDIPGSPFFWVGPSFSRSPSETVHPYNGGDTFRVVRNDPDLEFWQNATLVETMTVSMPASLEPFVFGGRWGWDASAIPPSYSLQPGITQAVLSIGGANCIEAFYEYNQNTPGTWTGVHSTEYLQWGVGFFEGGDAEVEDPNNPNTPTRPVFGYDTNTRCEFSIEGGNIVLRIFDWINYLDFIPNVGGVGTYTYTRNRSRTDDFGTQAQSIPVGIPIFGGVNSKLEYAYPITVANMPLRLGFIATEDSAFALPAKAGLKDVSFTFAGGNPGGAFAGLMRQSSVNKTGSARVAPDSFRFKQSFLGTKPSGGPITLADFNQSEHGYSRSS